MIYQTKKLWQHGDTGIMCWAVKKPSHRHYQVPIMYEDELPEMTAEEYDDWYETSAVIDGVRMGRKI